MRMNSGGISPPGSSEHQSGLAVDISWGESYYFLSEEMEDTAEYRWLTEHAHEYGFIIRYPRGRERVTGIRFEPWHIRYVGAPHAAYMAENGLTLEEYVNMLEPGRFYEIGGALASRQTGDVLALPTGWQTVTISPDNTGHYILTIRK